MWLNTYNQVSSKRIIVVVVHIIKSKGNQEKGYLEKKGMRSEQQPIEKSPFVINICSSARVSLELVFKSYSLKNIRQCVVKPSNRSLGVIFGNSQVIEELEAFR